MAKRISVKIENKIFNSLKDACDYLKIQHVAGLAHALKAGRGKYKGLTVEAIPDTNVKPKTKRHHTKPCPVVCETLGKTFKTIRDAARFAKANDWTMSKKMETAGQFKDKEGNIYKRVRPMNSKNVYENTGDTLKKPRAFAHRTVNKEYVQPVIEEVKPAVIQPAQPIIDKVQLAKDVLKEKVIESINANEYTLAKNLIDVIQEL